MLSRRTKWVLPLHRAGRVSRQLLRGSLSWMASIRHTLARRLPPGVTTPIRALLKLPRDVILNTWAAENPRAIYVTGHPRSGTTAIAQLLGNFSGLRVSQEMGWATKHVKDIQSRKMSLDALLRRYRYEFSRPIIQSPGLVTVLPQLRDRFPLARIAYIVRDPRDVVCSVIAASNRNASDDFVIHDPGFILFDNRWLGIDEPDPIRSLALRWCYCLSAARRVSGISYYRYEDFCEEKVPFIRSLANDLNLTQKCPLGDEIDTQYRGVGKISGPSRWMRMLPPEVVSAIEAICAEEMQRFGYKPKYGRLGSPRVD